MTIVLIEEIPQGEASPFGGKTRVVVKYPNGEKETLYSTCSDADDQLAKWIEDGKQHCVISVAGKGDNNSVSMVITEISDGNETITTIWHRPARADEISV